MTESLSGNENYSNMEKNRRPLTQMSLEDLDHCDTEYWKVMDWDQRNARISSQLSKTLDLDHKVSFNYLMN